LREVAVALLLAAAAGQSPAGKLGVGRAATAGEIAARDITVLPSGVGLPHGHGTARQGRALLATRCAVCHGARGEGQGDYPPLAGGRGSLTTDKPLPTVGAYWPYATTVWDYIRRGMPYDHPGTLSADEVYALTAFVLRLSDIVGEDQSLDERTLPQVKMPNRDGFVDDPRPDVKARR
jgi:mono/diheme cytochrome c family protein